MYHTCIHTHIHACMHACIHVMYVHIHMFYKHTHTRTHARTHTHTHTHTHTATWLAAVTSQRPSPPQRFVPTGFFPRPKKKRGVQVQTKNIEPWSVHAHCGIGPSADCREKKNEKMKKNMGKKNVGQSRAALPEPGQRAGCWRLQ